MKKIIKILTIIILVLLLLISIPIIFVLSKVSKVNYVEIPLEDIAVTEGVKENLAQYRNIVLFGIDSLSNNYEESRTDCIIIVSINETTKEIKLVSVYRDTYLEIPEKGLDKINHAYYYGGPALSMSTLNINLDLNITEFVALNFEATKDIIDKMGGIELTITDAEATQIPGISRGGTYNLTGEQALVYGRIRKIDSDYARTERMRTVVMKVFEKAKRLNVAELNKLADKLLPQIYTNVTKSEILESIPKISSYSIIDSKGWPYETRGITLDGVWYGPPVTLESNVEQLHKELFNKEEYNTTNKVKEISQKIIQKTGYR